MLVCDQPALLILERYSSFSHLKRITTWILHFVTNCKVQQKRNTAEKGFLSTVELHQAERFGFKVFKVHPSLTALHYYGASNTYLEKGHLASIHPYLDSWDSSS